MRLLILLSTLTLCLVPDVFAGICEMSVTSDNKVFYETVTGSRDTWLLEDSSFETTKARCLKRTQELSTYTGKKFVCDSGSTSVIPYPRYPGDYNIPVDARTIKWVFNIYEVSQKSLSELKQEKCAKVLDCLDHSASLDEATLKKISYTFNEILKCNN